MRLSGVLNRDLEVSLMLGNKLDRGYIYLSLLSLL